MVTVNFGVYCAGCRNGHSYGSRPDWPECTNHRCKRPDVSVREYGPITKEALRILQSTKALKR